VGRAAIAFGLVAMQGLPVRELAAAGFAALALGMVLAALASMYPSLRAARMPPMEAMRIE
jgi:ABC-type lipoprotein release transport system permease subunit